MSSVHGTEAAEEHGIRRSPKWPSVEKHFLAVNPFCIACNETQHVARLALVGINPTRGLQVHHAVIPFHYAILLGRPDLELDPRNLCVLCEDELGVKTEDHHNLVGHGRNFQSYLPDASTLAKIKFNGLGKKDLVTNKEFLTLCANLPKKWNELSQVEKDSLRTMLDSKLPKV